MMSPQIGNRLDNGSILAGGDITIHNIIVEKSFSLRMNVPEVDSEFIPRINLEQKLKKMIEEESILQIYGFSGIGKTELVKKVLQDTKDKYNKIYWLRAPDEIENDSEILNLEEICTFSGSKISILERISTEKTLVVVDNYNCPLNEVKTIFERNNHHDSLIIFTSKEKSSTLKSNQQVHVDFMDVKEAKSIFGNNPQFLTDKFEDFLSKLPRHPMTLRILKNCLLDEENGITISDFSTIQDIVNLSDNEISQSKMICEKILGNYYLKNEDVCKVLSIIDQTIIEANFLKKIIGPNELSKLVKKGFVKYEGEAYTIHSIILESLKAVNTNDNKDVPYRDNIYKFLSNGLDNKKLEYYVFISYNNNFIHKLYNYSIDIELKVLIYNVIVEFCNHANLDEHIYNIDRLLEQVTVPTYFSLKLNIERLELEISLVGSKDKEEKERVIRESIKKIDAIYNKSKLDKKCNLLLIHHKAKLYNWLREYDKAIDLLEALLREHPSYYASILQICRAYRQKITELGIKNSESISYMKKVESILATLNYREVPVSVYLELIDLIHNKPLNTPGILKNCLWNNFEYFSEMALLYSKNAIFEHIYLIIGDLSNTLGYKKQTFYKKWFEVVEHPSLIQSHKQLLESMIKIFCAEAVRRFYNKEDYEEVLSAVHHYWNVYKTNYLASLTDQQKGFKYNPIINCFIQVERPDAADNELKEIFDSNNVWHLKFKSTILKLNASFDEALTKIDEAIMKYKLEDHPKYLSAFYNDKAEILFESGKSSSIEWLKQAISLCDDVRTLESWKKKLEGWIEFFN